jgi:hypothetical protein
VQIFLNEKQLDVTLEGEKNLGEVIRGIENWLQSEGFKITDIQYDGDSLRIEEFEQWRDTSVKKAKNLYLTADTLRSLQIGRLQTVFQFFSLFEKAIDVRNLPILRELKKEYPFLREQLSSILSIPGPDSEGSEVNRLSMAIDELDILNTKENTLDLSSLKPLIQHFLVLSADRMREYSDPLKELLATGELLKQSIPEISDVSIMLQTGKDRKAMDSILKFIELSQKLIRLYPILKENGLVDFTKGNIDGMSFGDFYGALNLVLNELSDAFAVEDSVLIGDLLEYEIAPRIEALLTGLASFNMVGE